MIPYLPPSGSPLRPTADRLPEGVPPQRTPDIPHLLVPISNHPLPALVDLEDAWVLEFKWTSFTTKAGHTYAQRPLKRGSMLMHREIMAAPTGSVVDHLNTYTLDNRRANLEVTSNRRNILRAHPEGGVYPSGRRWKAQLGNKHIGSFDTEAEAKAARHLVWLEALYGEPS